MQNVGPLELQAASKTVVHISFPHFSGFFSPFIVWPSVFPPLGLFSSLALANTQAHPRESRQLLPGERRVRAVSANKRQSPPFSPATSHHSSPLCDRLVRCLSLSLARWQSLEKKKHKIYQQCLFLRREKRRFTVGRPDKQ